MKLSNRTLQILKNFSTINPSIIFSTESILETYAPTKNIFARAKIEEKFPQEWCIYDLSRFLSSISLFSDPDFEFNEHYVTLREGNSKTLNYVFCDRSVVRPVLPKDTKIAIHKTTVKFEMPMTAFKEVMKAINILKIPDLTFIGKDGQISLAGLNNATKETSDVYSVVIGETDIDFKIQFRVENLKLMDEEKYEVTVSDNGVCLFKSKDIEYYIAMENNSTKA